jgi:hypothetical protein
MRNNRHVVQLRVTHDEYEHLDRLARLRNITIEDVIREGLSLAPIDAVRLPERHLRLVPMPECERLRARS